MRVIELAVMAAEGCGWPAAGGVEDQTAGFLAAWRIVVDQRAHYQAQRDKARQARNG